MRTIVLLSLVALAMAVKPAGAQVSPHAARAYEGVGLSPRLGALVPARASLVTSDGKDVLLGSLLGNERPVVLTFVYHTCPMLCSALLDGLTRALEDIPWTPGKDYDLLSVSIDPGDTPELSRQQRERYLRRLDRPGADWHFLTGEENDIRSLAQAVGFGYRWVEEQQEYAHPAAVIVLTPGGGVSRYLPDVAPGARELRAAMVEAADGKLGTLSDRVFLYCFQYDAASNSYVMTAKSAMRVGGLFTALVLALGLSLLWMREGRAKRQSLPA